VVTLLSLPLTVTLRHSPDSVMLLSSLVTVTALSVQATVVF